LLTVLFLVATPAGAQVRDDAGFFTPNAVERANQLISQLRQQTKRELYVETIPAVPSDLRGRLQSAGPERFFADYSQNKAQQAGVDGVYVLVCREPSYLKVAVGDATQRAGLFTTANRDQLASTLLTSFKARQYDQGLLDAVALVQRTMTANAQGAATNAQGNRTLQTFPGAPAQRSTTPNAAPAPQPQQQPAERSGRGMFFWLIVLGGGFFLLMFIIRRLAARASNYGAGQNAYGGNPNVPPPLPGNPPQYGNYPGQGVGGGGFGRGMLGGLLGGAAGGWLYDRMSHRNDPGAHPGQGAPPVQSNPDPFSAAPDRDYSVSSGGDFGGDTGGGDFGGGGDDNNGGGSF
jgi:uncharacterized protein